MRVFSPKFGCHTQCQPPFYDWISAAVQWCNSFCISNTKNEPPFTHSIRFVACFGHIYHKLSPFIAYCNLSNAPALHLRHALVCNTRIEYSEMACGTGTLRHINWWLTGYRDLNKCVQICSAISHITNFIQNKNMKIISSKLYDKLSWVEWCGQFKLWCNHTAKDLNQLALISTSTYYAML